MAEYLDEHAYARSKPTRPWVTCGVLALGGILIFVLLIVFLVMREDREEQAPREAAIAAIQKTKEIKLADRESKFVATLSGDEARLLGQLVRQLMIDGEGVDDWSFNFEVLNLKLQDESGATTEIKFEHRQQYYLAGADEWYSGKEELTVLLKMIHTVHALRAGVERDKLVFSVESIVGHFEIVERHALDYPVFPWANATPEQRAFVERYLDAFNKVSGEPPLQWPR